LTGWGGESWPANAGLRAALGRVVGHVKPGMVPVAPGTVEVDVEDEEMAEEEEAAAEDEAEVNDAAPVDEESLDVVKVEPGAEVGTPPAGLEEGPVAVEVAPGTVEEATADEEEPLGETGVPCPLSW
jgi:hypothetical protein